MQSVWITNITKLLAGEESCYWKLWCKSNLNYEKIPSDFNSAKWVLDHTSLLNKKKADLLNANYRVFCEDQNRFELTGQNGVTLVGKADLIGLKNNEAIVFDCKTGKEKHSDKIQVMLYMLCLPHGNNLYKDINFTGEVVYSNNSIAIPREAITTEFRQQFKAVMNVPLKEPKRTPSFDMCKYCDIPKSVCKDKIENNNYGFKTILF